MQMIKILVTAYSVNPFAGSEEGLGWNFITQIARYHKVIAITRGQYKPYIERYMSEKPSMVYENIEFLYYDLPFGTELTDYRAWKRLIQFCPRLKVLSVFLRGESSHASLVMVSFYFWQRTLPAYVRQKRIEFDIAHNLNFHNDWTPSWLWKLNKPFVWGPIGHHPPIPENFIRPVYGEKAFQADRWRWRVKKYFWKSSPSLQKTVVKSDVILAMNSSVSGILPKAVSKIQLMPSVSSEQVTVTRKPSSLYTVLSVGRFVPLKGFDVTVRSFAAFHRKLSAEEQKEVCLLLVGRGPYQGFIENLLKEENIVGVAKILKWVDRARMADIYSHASVFLFPSHEGAGMVVAEALSYGLPVLCFDNCGPGEFVTTNCGFKVPYGDYKSSIDLFATYLEKLYRDKDIYNQLSEGAIKRFSEQFKWDLKSEWLKNLYGRLLVNSRET